MATNNPVSVPQTLRLASVFSEWQKLYDFIENFARSHKIPNETFQDLKLAAEEIVANIINHSYHRVPDHIIEITIAADNGRIDISFADTATACNPLELEMPEFKERGLCECGMGLQIIKSITDARHYERIDDRNVFTITKHYNS